MPNHLMVLYSTEQDAGWQVSRQFLTENPAERGWTNPKSGVLCMQYHKNGCEEKSRFSHRPFQRARAVEKGRKQGTENGPERA